MLKKILVLLFTIGLLFGAKGAYIDDIDVEKLKSLMQNGAKVVDIRTPEEWRHTGVIKDSELIMFFDEKGKYNINKFMSKFNRITSKKDITIIMCNSGNRSVPVADFLAKQGFKIYNLTHGIQEWISRKYKLIPPTIK